MNDTKQKIINIQSTDAFEDEVINANKSVVVDFWAEWCGPCRAIAPMLQEVADEKGDSVKVVKVNVDDNPDLARRFEIRSIPTLMFFRNGTAQDSLIGVSSKQAIIDKIDAAN